MRTSRLPYATRSSSVYDNIVYNLISFNNRLKLVGGGLLAWPPIKWLQPVAPSSLDPRRLATTAVSTDPFDGVINEAQCYSFVEHYRAPRKIRKVQNSLVVFP